MPTYNYTARDVAGRPQNGELTADNDHALVANLRQRGWIVLDVRRAAANSGQNRNAWNPLNLLPPTSLDIEIGMQQIASMLRSGLTLLTAIKTAAEQSRRPRMGAIWKDVYERIEGGSSLAQALEAHARYFPEFVIQLVRVGEQSGMLETVLVRAGEQLERARNLRMTLINALLYPTIVVILAIGVAGYMMLGVIPKIQQFLVAGGRRLPPITQMLVDVSTWFQTYGLQVLLFGFSALLAAFVIYRWPPGRLKMDALILRLPLIGKLLRMAATAQFSRNLGLLLNSGVTLLEGMQTMERLLGNRVLSAHIRHVRETVLQGGTLAAPLAGGGLFMPMLPRMVSVGEATGTLDTVLDEAADFHEKQLNATVRRMSVLIEPAVIVVVGGIVGFVYIAFFVALFSLGR